VGKGGMLKWGDGVAAIPRIEAMGGVARASCAWRRGGRLGHQNILGVDVGAHVEELVDKAEPAVVRRKMEGGLAPLRLRSGGWRC
jgi:hypothetical protein